MFDLFSGGFGVVGVIVFLLAALLALALLVLWFMLPFAVFGSKKKLDAIIAESQKNNAELSRITAELSAMRTEANAVRHASDSRS